MFQRRVLKLLVTTIATLAVAHPTNGNEATTVQQYIAEDVAGVAYIDLGNIDVQAALDQLGPIIGLPADQMTQAKQVVGGIQSQIEQFRKLGVGRVYMLLRVRDIDHGGPAWVVPVTAGGNAQQIVRLLEDMLPRDAQQQAAPLPKHFVVANGCVLGGSNPEQTKALEARRRQVSGRGAKEFRIDAHEAVAQFGGRSAGLVIFGDADSRRVIRELFPQMPAPFEEVDGRLIADRIRWASLTVDLPPNLEVQVTVQSTDATTAKTVEGSVVKALEFGKALLLERNAAAPKEFPVEVVQAVGMLRPEVDEARVSLTLGDDPEEIVAIGKLVAQPLRAAQQAARRNQRTNQFKQIALAFHNYYSRQKSFPSAATYDDRGRPLLSWRVAILPFASEKALYDKFRLDEPWDSEHNRKLIALMPKIYSDPDTVVQRAIGVEGCTTYVVPVGEQTVFHGADGMKFKEITDGTSQTVLAVEVIPDRAVIWTKPDDWKVDWSSPLDGVRRSDGRPFTASHCDGSVHIISNDVDPETWAKLLTPTGGELIE